MLIGINYTDAGDRTIARVLMDNQWTRTDLESISKTFVRLYDEVYVISIDKPLDKLFDIKSVVTEGCRIY